MSSRFTLMVGDRAPVQQSSTTCGSASLILARMLANPEFAQWMLAGGRERFAAYERTVLQRTSAARAADGGWQLPWPRSLGTSPWGAARELELGASNPEVRYEIEVLRTDSKDELRATHARTARALRPDAPALLYVGSRLLPRHVTLLVDAGLDGSQPGDTAGAPDSAHMGLYDPATGTVTELTPDRLAADDIKVAGWDTPWALVRPVAR